MHKVIMSETTYSILLNKFCIVKQALFSPQRTSFNVATIEKYPRANYFCISVSLKKYSMYYARYFIF